MLCFSQLDPFLLNYSSNDFSVLMFTRHVLDLAQSFLGHSQSGAHRAPRAAREDASDAISPAQALDKAVCDVRDCWGGGGTSVDKDGKKSTLCFDRQKLSVRKSTWSTESGVPKYHVLHERFAAVSREAN